MSNRLLIQRAIALCCLVLLRSSIAVADDPQALAAWKERGKQVKTLEAHWIRKRHMEPGSQPGKDLRTQRDDGTLIPSQAIDVEAKCSFWLADDRWRFEWQGEDWAHQVENVLKQHHVTTFDGKEARLFFGRENTNVDIIHSTGFVMSDTSRNDLAATPSIAVLLALYRPFTEPYGHFVPSEWSLIREATGTRRRFGNAECESVVFQKNGFPGRHKSVLVSADGNGAIHRMEFRKRLVFEVSYDAIGQSHKLRGWKTTKLSSQGAIQTLDEAIVTSIAENIPIAPSLFTCDFPDGTEVSDTAGGRDKRRVYIVRDGKERPVSMLEQRSGVPFSVLHVTQTDEFASRAPADHRPWLYIAYGIAGVTIVVLSAVAYRKHRRAE
jgi:hypothetical protein